MLSFNAGKFSLPLGNKTYIMGILNVTPDSFSDGGKYNTPEAALNRALEMQRHGADIIDIGANSTRPGAQLLSENEECERIKPFLSALRGKLSVPLSVDTFYAGCAALACDFGADIINDISGDIYSETAEIAVRHGMGYIAVHNPCGAQAVIRYEQGVTSAVREFFEECINSDFPNGTLCLDPGLGFGKSEMDNIELIHNAALLKIQGVPLLYGASRKRFLGTIGNIENPAERDNLTIAAHVASIAGGADIIRTHNVTAGVQSAKIADAVFRQGGVYNG